MLLDEGYDQFANPDFTKSVIAEGCGEDINNTTSNLFHLRQDSDSSLINDVMSNYMFYGFSALIKCIYWSTFYMAEY